MALKEIIPYISEENVLLFIGIAVALGFLGGRLFRKIGIPDVVGFILMGVVLGESVLGVFYSDLLDKSESLIVLALSFIGFNIGGQLKFDTLKKLGRSITSILLFETLAAFILVTIGVYLLTNKLYLALIFGALSSATAPASAYVLWTSGARGILTTTLLATIVLDDAICIILYGFASSFAKITLAHEPISIFYILGKPMLEIIEAVVLGTALGILLTFFIRQVTDRAGQLILTLASLLFCSGIAEVYGLSKILSSLAMGMSLVNFYEESDKVFDTVQGFVPPIYILFFVLVGARLNIYLLPKIGLIGFVYIAARSIGKMVGTCFGARISNSDENVCKYMGMCLFSQAGVVMALAIAIYHDFSALNPEAMAMSILVINVITASALILQLIGPLCIKYAVVKAGEAEKVVSL